MIEEEAKAVLLKKGKDALIELGVLKEVMREYEDGIIQCSEEPYSFLFDADKHVKAKIKELEKKKCKDVEEKVFHVIKGTYKFDCDYMKMNTYLLVSTEVDVDLNKIEEGYTCFAYVENITIPHFSEYGYVCINKQNGGIKRVY